MFTISVAFYKTRLRQLLFWVTGFIAVAVIGGALTIDLTGFSAADRFMIAHWGFRGLRLYLWFEAGVLVTIVAALGWSAITTGLDIARSEPVPFPGIDGSLRARISTRLGYAMVLLGSALTALAITTLVLFNSCRYMRII
ncbi:MAG: hypothetical protein AUG74_20970 [Bacteroidetes bacterium 13_1_20CM_4_60_6]|nr:MAG: hypothetical protein AUG74_20970 [Bacteroidetes bacterium 13_1_20CM_4_60_6]